MTCPGDANAALRSWVPLVIALLAAASPVTADTRTTVEAVYSKAQAKAGGVLYKEHCLVCHDKKYFRPVLKRWNGQTVAILFDVMVGSMPESNPGGLLDQEYVDILAYIFSLSRYPSGEQVLDHRDGALGGIVIEDP